MKYFNKYNDYKPVNEKVSRDFDIGVLDLLRPLFSSLGRVVSKKRLRSIANAYDSYLSIVYKQYLSEKKLNIPEDKVDSFNYKDLNDTLTVKPISKEGENAEILINDDNIDDILNDGQVNDDSTSGLVNDEPLNIDVDSDNEEIEEIEPSETDTDSKDDDDLEEIILDDDGDDEPDTDTEPDTEPDTELDDEIKKKIEFSEKDEDEYYKSKTDEEIRLEYHDVMTRRNSEVSNKRRLLKDLEKYKKIINKFNSGKQKESAMKKIPNIESKIDKKEEIIIQLNSIIEKIEKLFPKLKIFNESNNWTGGANYSSKWTKEDMDAVTELINPYKLIELSTKAEIIIENSNDRNSKKLKRTWEILKNSIHKRWYYTYDINKLESSAKTNKALADKKTTPEQKKTTKETMSISMAMKEIFGYNIDIYSSPYYIGLENDKKEYFLLNADKKVFLMKKSISIENDIFVYSLICNLSVTKDKKFTTESYFDTPDKGINITLMGKSFDLYKEEDKFPIIIFKKYTDNLYSLPVSSRGDKEYIDLVSLSISSLSDGLDTNGLVIDDTEISNLDTNISDEQIETIKNLKL